MQNFQTIQEKIHAAALFEKGIITKDEHDRILGDISRRNFSLAAESSVFMAAGVLMLTTGIGILVYKNIKQFGHAVLIASLALVVLSGFVYCFRKTSGYTNDHQASPGTGFDYILLISSILLLTLLQYVNFQTDLFGTTGIHYLLGGAFLVFNAYYFDHAGVLSAGISSIATYFGIRLHAFGLFEHSIATVAITSMLFAVSMEAAGTISARRMIKPHFRFTYSQLALHLFFISLLALITSDSLWYYVVVPAVAGYIWYFRYAEATRSFYLAFFVILYSYLAATAYVVRIVDSSGYSGDLIIYLILLYLIGSAVAGISFMKKLHKKLSE